MVISSEAMTARSFAAASTAGHDIKIVNLS